MLDYILIMYNQITIGIFFGFAITSVIGRLGYRYHTRRSLFLDDYIVLIGAMCLCAAIGILYKHYEFIFFTEFALNTSSFESKANANQIRILLTTPYSAFYAPLVLTWTTIFAVKFSFLIFFKKLISRVTTIHTYYWIVGIVTLLSWLFMLFEPLILCKKPSKPVGKKFNYIFHDFQR